MTTSPPTTPSPLPHRNFLPPIASIASIARNLPPFLCLLSLLLASLPPASAADPRSPQPSPAKVMPLVVARPSLDSIPLPPDLPPLNRLVMTTVKKMPAQGLYQANAAAIDALGRAVSIKAGQLVLNPAMAKPSFCSSATYLVFADAFNQWAQQTGGELPASTLQALTVRRQPDGTGLWGCWNANGPGTARLFHLLDIGRNFPSLAEALPGDFMKIFWNDSIGSAERGHSVIFLQWERDPKGEEFVTYWSSNMPDGYGTAKIPRSRIKRMLFSRLENFQPLLTFQDADFKDTYLAEMLKRPGTETEMHQRCGVPPK